MEYFLGSLITLLIGYFVYSKIISNNYKSSGYRSIRYRQSYVHTLASMKARQLLNPPQKRLSTQATKHLDRKQTRVVFYNDRAYWISGNTFFTANLINGIIDQNSTKVVDTMGIDKVELDKLSIIVEKLTEEPIDDNRNPGNEKLF